MKIKQLHPYITLLAIASTSEPLIKMYFEKKMSKGRQTFQPVSVFYGPNVFKRKLKLAAVFIIYCVQLFAVNKLVYTL